MPMHGGRIVARALKQEGVPYVFTLCGGHVMSIYDGCLDEGIGVVDVRRWLAAALAGETRELAPFMQQAVIVPESLTGSPIPFIARLEALEADDAVLAAGGAARVDFAVRGDADGAAVDFLAICPVFCCTCAVWIFKSYEAESFGSARIPIHCYEGVDDSPELAKRVEKRIFGGVE